ncbi:MAG: winged helix-turn-helix transcriptional regulator [Clostridia bacterium]|nr:winged helix-turn-helix transcriptional regulator [Clostridia bacterium]
MNEYEALALNLMQALDQRRKGPPHEEVSQTMRGEMAVLRLLEHEGAPLTAGDISRLLTMRTSRIAAVLGSLERKDMVRRQADARDRRRVQVTLTDKGRAFCLQRKREALWHMTALLTRLGQEDAAHFVRIMKRIHEILPDDPPPIPEDPEDPKEESCNEQ